MNKVVTGVVFTMLAAMIYTAVSAPRPDVTPAAAQTVTQPKVEAPTPRELGQKVIRSVKAQLKDGASAKFGKVVVMVDNTVCGTVNAKNSFGAYAGESGFVLTVGQDLFIQEHNKSDFVKIWENNCADKVGTVIN